jgi:nitrate reductase alpha subunit
MLGMPRFLGIQTLPAGSPGTRKVGFMRGGSTRMTSASGTALDLVVVIDVFMTETARLADYVLPAPTQFEKYEATF